MPTCPYPACLAFNARSKNTIPFMKLHRLILTVLTIFTLTGSLVKAADNSVLYWNGQALNATRLARNPPPMSSMILATYHIAIFDAVNGITHANRGWLINEPAP